MCWRLCLLLAGDIGGTKTLLAVYDAGEGVSRPVVQHEYPSAKFSSLEAVVREFLTTARCAVQSACFDVAGPVIDGRARLTNLSWTIDSAALRADLGLDEVFLLNDLEATAYAVPRLPAEELYTIQAGKPDARGAIAVIAPGTGLGEAFLVWANGSYLACASEGGHAGFGPINT